MCRHFHFGINALGQCRARQHCISSRPGRDRLEDNIYPESSRAPWGENFRRQSVPPFSRVRGTKRYSGCHSFPEQHILQRADFIGTSKGVSWVCGQENVRTQLRSPPPEQLKDKRDTVGG